MEIVTLLIGLGKGGSALLPYLLAKEEFDLVAVCDSNSQAVGVAIARQCGLAYYQNAVEAVQDLRPELAIDATGDPSLAGTLYEKRPAGTSVVTGEASHLLWELLAEHEAQRRWETRFNRVLDDMHSAMVVVQDAKIKFCNRSFYQLLGYSKRDILGYPYRNVLADDADAEELALARDRGREEGEKGTEEYDTRVVSATGDIREVQIRSRQTDWEGRPASLIVMNDVTELRTLQREREQFFRYMIHELRAPLSSLTSVVSVLKELDFSADQERGERVLSILRRATDRLNGFVNDFLELSRVEKQQLHLKCKPVDLEDVIEDEVGEQRVFAEDKGLTLTVRKWDRFDVRGDDFVIRTAVRNLLNNAVKYTEEGGITVSVEQDSESFRMAVSDTGVGLNEKEKKNIFQEFGRIKRTEGMQGTGLGLALVKRLVEEARGRVWVESEGEGYGCTFFVELPYEFGNER